MDSIEGYNYLHHTLKGLGTRKRSIDEQANSNSGNGRYNQNTSDRPINDRKKQDNKRGDKIINQHIDEKMKTPQEYKYGDVFRPE